MKQPVKIFTFIVMLSFIPASAWASTTIEVAGFEFDKVHQSARGELPVRGQGLLRYMIFIKAYAGVLYLPDDVDSVQVLDTVPRRLELAYFHAIKADDFARATTAKMAENVPPAQMGALSARLEAFNALYRDVQPGDRYALTFIPGQGTELSLNGRPLGVIPGDDFAAAVFAIWLGPQPIDRGFKKD
ncbi:MAG: chalcone isomerase family protein, partial [Desulfobacterales bacterium]|nr:chalcone isomerase family protein [Desulfobacterales bacterium]